MAKNVITLRIPDEIIEELKKVFGENVTTSDMIRMTVDNYLNEIKKAEQNIINFEIPVGCLSTEELKNFYKDVCEIETKVTDSVINQGYDYNLEYVKAVQRTKNLLISHMSIDKGSKDMNKTLENLK